LSQEKQAVIKVELFAAFDIRGSIKHITIKPFNQKQVRYRCEDAFKYFAIF